MTICQIRAGGKDCNMAQVSVLGLLCQTKVWEKKPWVLLLLYLAAPPGSAVAEAAGFHAHRAWSICSFHEECRTHTLCGPLFPPSAHRTPRGLIQRRRAAASLKHEEKQLWLCVSGILGSSPVPQSHPNPLFTPAFISEGQKQPAAKGRATNRAQGSHLPRRSSHDSLRVPLTFELTQHLYIWVLHQKSRSRRGKKKANNKPLGMSVLNPN